VTPITRLGDILGEGICRQMLAGPPSMVLKSIRSPDYVYSWIWFSAA